MDTPEVFYAKVFLLFWIPFSMFAAIVVYDRAKRRGMPAGRWGLFTFATGAAGLVLYFLWRKRYPRPLADKRPAGIPGDIAAGSARAERALESEKRRRPSLVEEEIEFRHQRKMQYFYIAIMMLPLLGFVLGEGVLASSEAANFALFSVVFFLIVFFLRDEFTHLPLVPKQWEIVFGAAIIGGSFALIPLKPLIESIGSTGPTRPFGMLNYAILLIGVLLAFFGVSNFRIPLIKAVALIAGLAGVFFGLLNFSPTLAIAALLVCGTALVLYGVNRLPPIFMPGLVVMILVLINSAFYDDKDIQNMATVYLGEFVAKFSSGLVNLLGIPEATCVGCVNRTVFNGSLWDIQFRGGGIPGGDTAVSIAGNCTGIVGAMFYGFIASVILLWVRAEWWRKAAVLAGGVIGSFMTNLFRVSTLLWVYWEYDYPKEMSYSSTLWYVHEHLGDVLYIVFILVYWVFVFRVILPRQALKGGGGGPSEGESRVDPPRFLTHTVRRRKSVPTKTGESAFLVRRRRAEPVKASLPAKTD